MSDTIKLLETHWEAPGGAAEVEREFPIEPVQDFVNKMRRNRHQWAGNPGIITIWMRQFDEALDAYEANAKEKASVEEKRRSQTEAARKALAEKRERERVGAA